MMTRKGSVIRASWPKKIEKEFKDKMGIDLEEAMRQILEEVTKE